MQKKYPKFFSTLRMVLAVLFIGVVGMITGILGGIISPQVFLPEDIIQLRPIIFEDKTIQRKVEKEINISDSISAIAPSMGELYSMAPRYRTRDFDENILPLAKDFLGYALVGTADGWIILPPSVANVHSEDIRFIDNEKRVFHIATRVSDTATGVQYGKISSPENVTFRPLQFDTTTDIGPSKHVIQVLNPRTGVLFALTPLEYPSFQILEDAIQSPSVLKKRFNASQKFSSEGAPFITEKKEIIGFSTTHGILPMAYVQDSFTQLLRSKKIYRPTLPIRYIDLSLFPIGLSVQGRGLIKNGAYVTGSKRPSVIPGPLGGIFLSQGDIINSINNETLDVFKSFSEVIRQYKKGDTITLEYLHAGEKKIGQVTLQ